MGCGASKQVPEVVQAQPIVPEAPSKSQKPASPNSGNLPETTPPQILLANTSIQQNEASSTPLSPVSDSDGKDLTAELAPIDEIKPASEQPKASRKPSQDASNSNEALAGTASIRRRSKADLISNPNQRRMSISSDPPEGPRRRMSIQGGSSLDERKEGKDSKVKRSQSLDMGNSVEFGLQRKASLPSGSKEHRRQSSTNLQRRPSLLHEFTLSGVATPVSSGTTPDTSTTKAAKEVAVGLAQDGLNDTKTKDPNYLENLFNSYLKHSDGLHYPELHQLAFDCVQEFVNDFKKRLVAERPELSNNQQLLDQAINKELPFLLPGENMEMIVENVTKELLKKLDLDKNKIVSRTEFSIGWRNVRDELFLEQLKATKEQNPMDCTIF